MTRGNSAVRRLSGSELLQSGPDAAPRLPSAPHLRPRPGQQQPHHRQVQTSCSGEDRDPPPHSFAELEVDESNYGELASLTLSHNRLTAIPAQVCPLYCTAALHWPAQLAGLRLHRALLADHNRLSQVLNWVCMVIRPSRPAGVRLLAGAAAVQRQPRHPRQQPLAVHLRQGDH